MVKLVDIISTVREFESLLRKMIQDREELMGLFIENVEVDLGTEQLFVPSIEDYGENITEQLLRYRHRHDGEEITGNCPICGLMLTLNYPSDYPDKWKICCNCFSEANRYMEGIPPLITDSNTFMFKNLKNLINLKD